MAKHKGKMKVGMATPQVADTQDDAIDALMAELTEAGVVEETVEQTTTENDIEAAVASAETVEHYESQPGDPSPDEVKKAEVAAKAAAKAEAKAEKARVAAEKRAEREKQSAIRKETREAEKQRKRDERAAKKAAREAEKAAKPKRVFWGANKMGRLKATLGDQLKDYMVLTSMDASLSDAELESKQAATMEKLDKIGVKVKNRACLLFDFLSGKTDKLNAVMETAIRLLATDGKIVSGDKGNLHLALLAKPYSAGTARATGNNTISLFKILEMISPSDKQSYTPRAESLLLAKANSMLGIE